MTDRYTKTVLTVIAAALVVLAVQNAVRPAAADPLSCGSSLFPCYVATSPRFGLAVTNAFGGDGKLLPLQVTSP